MKAVVILLSIVAFIACLILGIQAGNRSTASSPPQPTATQNLWSSSQEQRTILLIVADDLHAAAPKLVSVWAVLYRPDMPTVTFLPLFPPSTLTSPSSPPDLSAAFHLDSNHSPSDAFLSSIKAYRFEWNGYLLIDLLGVGRTVDWLQGINLSNNMADGAAALASLINPWDDPVGGLQSQQHLIQSVCGKIAALDAEANWLELAGTLMPQHLHTNLSMETAISDWKTLAGGSERIHCDAPIQ